MSGRDVVKAATRRENFLPTLGNLSEIQMRAVRLLQARETGT